MSVPSPSYIHGSIPTIGGEGQTTMINANMSWSGNFFPYNRPGFVAQNGTHLGCISNNATLLDVCCTSLNGTYISSEDRTPSDNVTDYRGISRWCMFPEDRAYNNEYVGQPGYVGDFGTCYNATVIPSNNPGNNKENVTFSSDIWRCELYSSAQPQKYSGSNVYDYPSLSVNPAPTNNAQTSGGGRFSGMVVAGVVSLVALKACGGI